MYADDLIGKKESRIFFHLNFVSTLFLFEEEEQVILTNAHVEMEGVIRRVIILWEATFVPAGKGTELLLINTHVKAGLFYFSSLQVRIENSRYLKQSGMKKQEMSAGCKEIDSIFNLDLDECSLGRNVHHCAHNCTNMPGSYYCTCSQGFELSANRRTCNGK